MWEVLKRPSFVVAAVVYAMGVLGYLLWIEARNVYAVTTKQEITQLADQTSMLRSRVDQSETPLKDAITFISTLIDKKVQNWLQIKIKMKEKFYCKK